MVDLQARFGWAPEGQDAALLVLTLFVLWWMVGVLKNFNKRFPPGPTPLPIIGNLLQMKRMHRALDDFRSRYGPIIYLKLGSVPVIVVSNHEYAREFLRVQDQNFAFRPQETMITKYLFENGDALPMAPIGDHWRQMRKVLATQIFIPKRLRVFKDQRLVIIKSAVNEMFKETNEGRVVDIKAHLVALMYNVVTHMVMGKVMFGTVSATSRDQDDFRAMTSDLLKMLGSFAVKDWFPWTRILGDFQGLERKMQDTHDKFDRILQGSLDLHRKARVEREERRLRSPVGQEGDLEEKEDYVDLLLRTEGEPDNPVTDKERKLLMQPLLTGGTEPASTVILWALSELCKRPEWMKRLQDEIDSVVGSDRLVQEHDLPNLPTLTAIIKETFRLHPNACYLLPRQGVNACKVGPYDIPKAARVIVCIWSLNRDEAVWEDPLDFKPERFLGPDDPYEFNGSSFKFLPFGAGRRLCPGLNLGLLMVELGLANLVHLCDITLPAGVKPEDVDLMEKAGINLMPLNPIKVRVSPRLAPEVYEIPT